jgi:hypothetical protein
MSTSKSTSNIQDQLKNLEDFRADRERILELYLNMKNKQRHYVKKLKAVSDSAEELRKKWSFLQEYEGRMKLETKKALMIDNRPEEKVLERKKKADERKEKKRKAMETEDSEGAKGKKKKLNKDVKELQSMKAKEKDVRSLVREIEEGLDNLSD